MTLQGCHVVWPYVLLSVCLTTAYIHEVSSEIDSMIELLLGLNENICSYSLDCSNASFIFNPMNSDDGLCCEYCECYDNCIMEDFCCPDAVTFTKFEGYSTDVRDFVTKAYETARIDTLQYRYSLRYNTTEGFDEVDVTDIITRSTCMSSSLLSNGWEFLYYEAYYLVSNCPENYPKDSETYSRCIGTVNDTEMVDMIPETSLLTYISYKNYHCRMCNEPNISSVPWEVGIYCLENEQIQIPPLSSLQDLIEFDAEDPNCIISFQPFEDLEFITFYPICLHIHVSSCNVSGKWELYDSDIERACETIYSPVKTSIKHFHNGAFIVLLNTACFVCNSNEEDKFGVPCSDLSHIQNGLAGSVHATLRIAEHMDFSDRSFPPRGIVRAPEIDSSNVCRNGEFYVEHQGVCRERLCPRDHRANGEMCLPLYEFMNGISVEVKMKVKFERSFFMPFLSVMEEILFEMFISYFSNNNISLCSITSWLKFTDGSQTEIDYFFYHVKIKTNRRIMYSTLRYFIENLVKRNESFGEMPDLDNNKVNYNVSFADDVIVNEKKSLPVVYDANDGQPLLKPSVKSIFDQERCSVTIVIGHTSLCERIILYPNEFEIKNHILIILPGVYQIPKGRYDINDDRVFVCIDELSKKNIHYILGDDKTSLNTAIPCIYFGHPGLILTIVLPRTHL